MKKYIYVIAFLLSLATPSWSDELPEGEFILTLEDKGLVDLPTIATINTRDGKPSTLNFEHNQKSHRVPIHFKELEGGVSRPTKYYSFNAVAVADDASWSIVLSGIVGNKGVMSGVFLTHESLTEVANRGVSTRKYSMTLTPVKKK
ncbi:hypothetical protein SAMN02745181_0445 [Rubritalea squalenifaciens DSM 18772]|uniref:Uncharacterized protein n=1 Tax=Rubritalea squalenifaciens DSM 18772 TaxID=1123071 RepID=A0A1M6CCG3_9BACT|nr:hypothetical protein [Rubritalea squalenifaciens]SHI58686.1 hypothetical protein SAMN02745181_0445 [Rubritalea squalenifaciens DSM 18772]